MWAHASYKEDTQTIVTSTDRAALCISHSSLPMERTLVVWTCPLNSLSLCYTSISVFISMFYI